MTPDSADETVGAEAAGSTTHRTVSMRLSSVLTTALAVAALAIIITLTVLLWSARSDLSHRDATARDNTHAEQIATNYAVGASTINFQDFNAWLTKLKTNTSPQLAGKFDATAPQLQTILTPLKWTSTAQPIAAKVESNNNGIYKVNVFLTVTSTSAQTPQGGQTTVTYNITLDRNAAWKITDVGGLDGALPAR